MAKPAPYLKKTMEWLRKQGFAVGKTEQWIPRARYQRKSDGVFVNPKVAGVRRDLFGWIDAIAFSPSGGIVGVQATSRAGIPEHVRKMQGDDVRPLVLGWLQSGGRVLLVGWRKENNRWVPHEFDLDETYFQEKRT